MIGAKSTANWHNNKLLKNTIKVLEKGCLFVEKSMKNNKNVVSYIHVAIMITLMLCGSFLPTFGQITPLGMKVFGVFLGLLYGWVFVGILWPSVLGFFTLSLTGVTNPLMAFGGWFFQPNHYNGYHVLCTCL